MGVLIDPRPRIGDVHPIEDARVDKINSNLSAQSVSKVTINGDQKPIITENTSSGAPHTQNHTTQLEILDRYIDEPRPLKVAVIGGGLAGILAGVLLPVKVPGIQLTIYEKNKDLGGTWLENIYPGVRCDIPSHVYQSTFEPKRDWSDEFAPGHEIRDYWQSVAKKHNVYQYAKFEHLVTETSWDPDAGKWRLTAHNSKDNQSKTLEYDFVLTCTGRFNDWKLPNYPGINDFKGTLRHTSNWDPTFDPTGKRIAVIGNGASGIQVVATLQKTVSRLDHYARNKTWIATSWAGDERTAGAQPIEKELQDTFQDSATYISYRKKLEDKYWRGFPGVLRGNARNASLRDSFIQVVKKRLSKKPEMIEQVVPDFSPNCRRLTPGPGYLEAITEDNVDYIRTPIRGITATGIETEDGVHREVDAIFCATGSKSDLVPRFPITAHGKTLADVWAPNGSGEQGFPYTYMGVATPGFPNLLFVHGPFGTGPSGTVPQSVESQLAYVAKLLRKASREGIKAVSADPRAADDFNAFAEAFFKTTVFSEDCSSWYNGGRPGGRVHGIWPGSAAHLAIVRREPRWEDWRWEHLGKSGNRFQWYLGNGATRREADPEEDITAYLTNPEEVDLRDVHESWWSVP
ncbi:Flavin monooxygenase-like protein [Cordyceps fumosorosea ARSEF 2679]|uniref:Flavin monooxygenase-like protein n=1 Tax=Cordyceps fumosorosea (strain ARSEF 2679) TaxID=1081104 RepID=A0A168BWW5_CORFA|nr:Flavin monooxygenase-like protein [Cordyceps fumosorosea ARSEF 2679]OAA70650.1 Flavin monooxygenase-like protein [Cordyceps fumosorosea ARSEF 2679]